MAQAALNQTAEEIPAPVKTVKMELKRHYVPHKLVSIVGYQRPERKVKNAAGDMVVATEAKFIDGEMFPPIFAGVGYDKVIHADGHVTNAKIWAGTVIEVPEDEGKTMRQKGIGEVYL